MIFCFWYSIGNSSFQCSERSVQPPASTIKSPASRVQHPESSFQSPASNTCIESPGILVCLNKSDFTGPNNIKSVLMFNQNLLCFSFEWLSLPFGEIKEFFLLSLFFSFFQKVLLRFSQICEKFTEITKIITIPSSFCSENMDKGLSMH